MSESTPPHGRSLLDQVDLTADVQPEGPLSAPAAKKARLSLQQPSSSGSSATGRPQGTLWGFYTRSSQKQNKSHYSASCDPCSFAGTNARVLGTADSMRSHLLKCPNVPDAVHEWAKKWTPKSEPYVADAADSGAATTPARSQTALQRFMSFKDVAMSDTQHSRRLLGSNLQMHSTLSCSIMSSMLASVSYDVNQASLNCNVSNHKSQDCII